MTLTRWNRQDYWNPFQQLSNIRDELDRMFESPSGFEEGQPFFKGWGPALDLYEDKDNLTLKAELPGMKREDIEISLHEGALTISGERKASAQEAGTPVRSERFVGRFSRSLALPSGVNADKVKASYKDGVLTVVLPKAEHEKPKQIQVKGD